MVPPAGRSVSSSVGGVSVPGGSATPGAVGWLLGSGLLMAALALCGGVFGSLLYANYDIATQYTTLVNALRDQNVNEGDVHAVSLQQNGTVTIDGRTYGGERIQRLSSRLFDDEGNVLAPLAARGLLADQYPSYAPRWMIERPETTRLLAVVCTMLILLVI